MDMSQEDTNEFRQKSELEVLKSIYGKDLKDLNKNKKSYKWQPIRILLTLNPLRGSSGLQEVHVRLDVEIVCSEDYPDAVPDLVFKYSKGMSDTVLLTLKEKLEGLALQKVGQEMIFDLAECIQNFLHEHNKPPSKSFYEEMLMRKEICEQRERERVEQENAKKRQTIMDEVQERQEILKLESKRRKEKRLSSETSNESNDSHRRRSLSRSHWCATSCEIDNGCERSGVEDIEFSNNGLRNILRGRCIYHTDTKSVMYSGMDQETGEIFMISEWNVDSKLEVSQKISKIEQELNYLVKLRHQNLVHYLNLHYVENTEKLKIYILQEFIYGINCDNFYLFEGIPIDMDMLKHIAEGVLSALDYLHRNNVIHRNLRGSCVYIDQKGIVKLANYSLEKRLCDLVSSAYISNCNKKTDIFKFGLFVLSLLKGSEVDESSLEIPSNISGDLYDFLDKCLKKEEKDRNTAMQLLHHSFLKTPLVRNSPQRNCEEKAMERNNSPETQATDHMIAQTNLNGQSRVEKEFEILDHLGKGAYGEVFKVQNILDGGCYALKKIELNPKNKQLNKKIIREVKLLSRLNHENVVRYYYSWIETAIINKIDDGESTVSSCVSVSNKNIALFTDESMIEKLAPPIKDVEWSVISYYGSNKKDENNSTSSSEESSDEDEDWGFPNLNESSDSDCVEFEHNDDEVDSKTIDLAEVKSDTADSQIQVSREIQFMYIQMEFCEKSTLRTAIDNNLYQDHVRLWRLFREIVEGLTHIHQQGMIHRDLKPMNIFLDSNDHVKIGDFGLATTNLLVKPNDMVTGSKSYTDTFMSLETGGDPSMTGHIGTALYVAPELAAQAKANYNQKVDIYSLGIIFFEMCYKPLTTGMERIKVLTGLRNEDIEFPLDFTETGSSDQEYIVRWLLEHDTSKRPSSKELLQSDKLPPPVLEECELRELVRHTLSKPQLKAYKYLVESCFKQGITPAQDITYDKDLTPPCGMKNLQQYNYIREEIIKVFQLHGGQNLSTPLLMPKSKYYESVETCVKFMNHSGGIVSIPHDLRVPFARYVAWNGIVSFRRYSIERVYREKKVFGFIPRELYECAFDIVTPSAGNFMPDAEVLYILNEVINQVPGLKNKHLFIRLNHTLLLRAILLHCGIKDKHNELCSILSDAREGKATKLQLRTHLISNGLSDYSITTLINMLDSENTLPKTVLSLQQILKRKNSEACQFAKQAVNELKTIIQNAEALGVVLNLLVSPGLVYNVQQYSGMMCQLVCEVKKKHKQGMDVLAAGGRYDNMINSYRKMMMQANIVTTDVKQSAVGISISLDKLIQAMNKDEDSKLTQMNFLDVVVCSLGNSDLTKEKSKILHDLWEVGIRCCLIEAKTNEDIQEQCKELNVPHVIILKDTEHGMVKVQTRDKHKKDEFQEKKFSISGLVEGMQRILRAEGANDVSNAISRSDSRISHGEKCEHNQEISVTIHFTEKVNANNRKRTESQIRSSMDGVFQRLNGEVCLIALNLDGATIMSMALHLDFDDEHRFDKSVEVVKEKNQKHRKSLGEMCDQIYEQKQKKNNPVIILYSLQDGLYNVLL